MPIWKSDIFDFEPFYVKNWYFKVVKNWFLKGMSRIGLLYDYVVCKVFLGIHRAYQMSNQAFHKCYDHVTEYNACNSCWNGFFERWGKLLLFSVKNYTCFSQWICPFIYNLQKAIQKCSFRNDYGHDQTSPFQGIFHTQMWWFWNTEGTNLGTWVVLQTWEAWWCWDQRDKHQLLLQPLHFLFHCLVGTSH